jgi:DNA end-binding protein Ku
MRAIRSLNLSFGLVNIPVKIYSGTAGTGISFRQLHAKDFAPIRYAKVCTAEEEEVPQNEIVRGYEYQKGEYIVLTDEDLEEINPRKTNSIDVLEFVDAAEVDPKYLEKPYYLEPDKGAARAYALMRDALKRSGRVGIARFMLRSREHLGLIKPDGRALMLHQMRYHTDLVQPDGLDLPDEMSEGRELEVAMKLISQLTEPFQAENYRDTFREEFEAAVERKARGETIRITEEEPEPSRVPDLMEALLQSLQQEQSRRQHQEQNVG